MIGIKVEKSLKNFLHQLAEEENRSLSNFITNAVLTYIKEHKDIDWKDVKKKSPDGSF